MNNTSEVWLPILDAPRDGSCVEVITADGDKFEARWEENRFCMLASVAPGAGSFGAGWVDSENGLPCYSEKEPVLWRHIIASQHGAATDQNSADNSG